MKPRIPIPAALLCCILINAVCHSQSLKVSRYYTITDGLPSNSIYKCVQDKMGFLWIATENGLSRFDGQHFKNFTVADGLPDNEILDIFLDSAQRLWIIPFNKNPAYVDTRGSKIINSSSLPYLSQIQVSSGFSGNVVDKETVAFYEERKTVYLINGGNLKHSDKTGKFVIYIQRTINGDVILSHESIGLYQNGKLIKEFPNPKGNNYPVNVIEKDGALYMATSDSTIYKIEITNKYSAPVITQKKLPFKAWTISALTDNIGVAGMDGVAYILSATNLSIIKKIETGENVKRITEDNDGNYWLCTGKKGLIKVSSPVVDKIPFPDMHDKNITALFVDSSGLLAGNNSGELVAIKGKSTQIIQLDTCKNNNLIITRIEKYKAKKLIITYQALYINNKILLKNNAKLYGFKCGIFLSDSTLLLGSYKYLYKYNIITNKIDTLLTKRITAVAALPNGDVYFGSNNGLYKLKGRIAVYLGATNNILTSNTTALQSTADNLLWVGMASDTIVAIKNDSIILRLPIAHNFRGSICKSLGSNKKGQLWIGTERSLGKIDYTLTGNTIAFKSFFFSVSDGLGEGQVNQIVFFNDTIYAGMSSGVSKINVNAKPVVNEIPVFVTKVLINSKESAVQDIYNLSSTENNIQIDFAGVDLSEFNPQFQFQVNGAGWQDIAGNTLLLSELAYGNYVIKIRALKRNNEPSALMAVLHINIKTPLLRSPVFLTTAFFALLALAIFLFTRYKLTNQKRKLQQQLALEQQRNKITADLHDDIGASLSSLQVNSAVANQLIDKDAARAKELLEKIEWQSHTLADKIGDIIWSMKPGKDEFMTLSTRIKNFANDILGATNIHYEINIDPVVDTIVKDITVRKNIVFIAKEAINNTVKYSKAGTLHISLQLQDGVLLLTITDDGIGFIATENCGNGLANMRRRAEEIKGSLTIASSSLWGTTIAVSTPIVP